MGTLLAKMPAGVNLRNLTTAIKARLVCDQAPRQIKEELGLLGDPGKARQKLGWRHKTSFPDLVREMVESDRRQIRLERERVNRHD